MAVNNTGGNKPTQSTFTDAMGAQGQTQQNAQPQQEAPSMNQQQQAQSNPLRRGGSIMDINSLMSRPMSRQSSGEVVLRYEQALRTMMEANLRDESAPDFKLLVLDNNAANVGPVSSLLICFNVQHHQQRYTAVYTLLVEGSAERLEPKTYSFGGNRNVAIDTVPGDVFATSDHLRDKIEEHVKVTYGNSEIRVLDAGAMTLPTELSHEDDYHLRQVLFNASQACFTVMEQVVGQAEPPFTVGMVNSSAEALSARLTYNSGEGEGAQDETSTGLPIRDDMNITLVSSQNQQHNDGFSQTRPIATVSGFVDLVYQPPFGGQQTPMNLTQQQQMQHAATKHYYPRFVITKMDTAVDAITLELQLLTLAQATLASNQMAWAGCFRPRTNIKGKQLDIHDIGAVGYEVPLSGDVNAKRSKVDTKSASFDIQQLYQLLITTFHDDLIYSMDIEEVGELSWIHQLFFVASRGDQGAEKMIKQAADNLTDGHFSAIHHELVQQQGGDSRVAVDDQNRIHLGYYNDNGQKRDIRDVDYLALLNVTGKEDPEAVVRWGETFDNTSIPEEIRLADRAELIRGMMGSNVEFKGYARRITFIPTFLVALNAACHRAGLNVRTSNMIQEFQGGVMRGNMTAGNYGVNSQSVNGLFNSSAGQPQRMQGGLSTFQTGFSRNGLL